MITDDSVKKSASGPKKDILKGDRLEWGRVEWILLSRKSWGKQEEKARRKGREGIRQNQNQVDFGKQSGEGWVGGSTVYFICSVGF